MPHRFYSPQIPDAGSVLLEDAEAHHLMHVLRHSVGDAVELFDGLGKSAECRIVSTRKRDVTLEVVTARLDPVSNSKTVILATSVPKGDRFDWLIEKATELGVSRLIPITTQRSVVDPRSSKLEKLRNTVIAACKQSNRNTLMEISPVTPYEHLLRTIEPETVSLIAHPAGGALADLFPPEPSGSSRFMAFIGPEGGFSDEEIQAATAVGVRTVGLGSLILRIETAAIAIVARLLM